jgi:DNA invertase Pin-like site-specific DNA recombinase
MSYSLHKLFAKWEMEMAVLGYARVSTKDQHLTGQLEALKAAGAVTIYREKISGARADRPRLAKLMASLQPGDVVLVTKLDRLGRSTRELLNLMDDIKQAGAAFKSLGDPLWDTTTAQGRLLSTVLASIAEFERELIRERTGEGRDRAKAKGVRFGRKPKMTPHQRQEAIARLDTGETLAAIAKTYNVDLSTISRLRPFEGCAVSA